MKREFLKVGNVPFIPDWAVAQWGHTAWMQIKKQMEQTCILEYSQKHRGFLYYDRENVSREKII